MNDQANEVQKTTDDLARHLSRSVLLEETGSPLVVRATILFGCAVIAAFIVWAFFTRLDEVALATGGIIPSGETKLVQHLQGGRVAAIRVKDGDAVRAGDVLVELDPIMDQSQVAQVRSELANMLVQKESIETQHRLLAEELAIRQKLVDKGLNSKITFLSMQRQLAGLKKELAGVDASVTAAQEKLRRAGELLSQLEIRAPIDGTVNALKVNTVGGIITPGERIAEIVPSGARLVATLRISPNDIGHIHVAQPVLLKLATYNFGKYGGVNGKLLELSATTLLDEQGKPYYRGIVELERNYVGECQPCLIMPGMTLQADIKTGGKTVFEYLLKPIYSSASSAMRER